MDKEEDDYFLQRWNMPSFWDRMKIKIKLLTMPKSEIKAMKRVLIEDAKPYFFEYIKPEDQIKELMEKCYDERIETLPREPLYNAYTFFNEFKTMKGKKYEMFAYNLFVFYLQNSYSLNGWFREKIINLIRTS